MGYRFLLILLFAVSIAKCQDTNNNKNTNTSTTTTTNNNTATDTKGTPVKDETKKPETLPAPKIPAFCTICNCTTDKDSYTVSCHSKNLTNHFEDSEWPMVTINVMTIEGNSLIHVKPFVKAVINKLSLQNNKITKIDNSTFKQLINLTELDLSYNELTTENLPPEVFEGRFSPEEYEPLAKLTVLNLAHNMLHSLHHDLLEHMSRLKVLNLSGNLFTKIDGRTSIAISSLPYLEDLDLSYCGLSELPKLQFYNSRHLKKLDLSGNMFMAPPVVLEDAHSLEILYMDENPMKVISKQQGFPTMSKLKELSLCCMPHLATVGRHAFAGLPELEHLRLQNCPELKEIDEYALQQETEDAEWPPLKKLDLSDNALQYLPAQLVARWDNLEELDLINNKWSCDCDNQYLIGIVLPQYGKKLMGADLSKLTCATPPEHVGKNLSSLSHRKLRCLDFYGARPEKDATLLIGALVGLLLAIPVCLTVVVLWRRGFFFCGTQGPASFSRAFYKRASNDDEF